MISPYQRLVTNSIRIAGYGDEPLRNAQTRDTVTGATGTVVDIVDSAGARLPDVTFPIPFTESPGGYYWATVPPTSAAAGTRWTVITNLSDPQGSVFASKCPIEIVEPC